MEESLPLVDGHRWWIPTPVDQDLNWKLAEACDVKTFVDNQDEIWCVLLPIAADPNVLEQIEAIAIADWDIVWATYLDLYWVDISDSREGECIHTDYSDRLRLRPTSAFTSVQW